MGEVERNSFIALPGKVGHIGLMPSRLCARPGGGSEESYSVQRAGRDRLVDVLLIGRWGGNGESASTIFWFQMVWRVYVLVGSIQLTSSTCWGVQYLQNSSKDMAQNIIYSL